MTGIPAGDGADRRRYTNETRALRSAAQITLTDTARASGVPRAQLLAALTECVPAIKA